MRFVVFGSIDESGFAPGWSDEELIVLFGSAKLDLTRRMPGPDAALTVLAIFAGARIVVPPGTRVLVSGFALFGGRKVSIQPGAGPYIRMALTAFFGGITVVEARGEPSYAG